MSGMNQELFDLIASQTGKVLVQSELNDIINLVLRLHPQQDVQGLIDLIEECKKSIHASHQKEGGKLGLLMKIDDVLKSYQEGGL